MRHLIVGLSLIALGSPLYVTSASAASPVPKVSDLDFSAEWFLPQGDDRGVPLAPQSAGAWRQGGFRVVYSPTRHPALSVLRERYRALTVFEELLWGAGDPLTLEREVTVQVAECGAPNAYWSASERRMLLCYEMPLFLAFALRANGVKEAEIDAQVHGTVLAIIWHEFGHLLQSELDLPIVGNSEDAADQLSTLILLGQGEEGAEMAYAHAMAQEFKVTPAFAKARLDAVAAIGKAPPSSPEGLDAAALARLPYMAKHSFGTERKIDILCMLYGHSPTTRHALVGPQGLHPARAEKCPRDFEQLQRNWTRLLAPHMKPPKAIATLRCERMATHSRALFTSLGAPKEALKELSREREAHVAACVEETLADPEGSRQKMRCLRRATTREAVMACGKKRQGAPAKGL